MSRPLKRSRHKLSGAQLEALDQDFTPDTIEHHLAVAFPGDSFDAEVVTRITQVLNNWRWLVAKEKRQLEAKRRNRRLTEALATLAEVLPATRKEIAETLAMTEGADSNTSLGIHKINARQPFVEGLLAIDTLTAACNLVANSPIPSHPEMRIRGVDHWEAYTRPVETLLSEKLSPRTIKPSKEGVYRFISSIAPALTRESVSFDSVKSHLKRGRRVNRAKLPL